MIQRFNALESAARLTGASAKRRRRMPKCAFTFERARVRRGDEAAMTDVELSLVARLKIQIAYVRGRTRGRGHGDDGAKRQYR